MKIGDFVLFTVKGSDRIVAGTILDVFPNQLREICVKVRDEHQKCVTYTVPIANVINSV